MSHFNQFDLGSFPSFIQMVQLHSYCPWTKCNELCATPTGSFDLGIFPLRYTGGAPAFVLSQSRVELTTWV